MYISNLTDRSNAFYFMHLSRYYEITSNEVIYRKV